jgi:hypothetical protein
MTFSEIQKLNGRSVLVQPAHSPHNPPIGVRGTLQVSPSSGALPPQVEIVIAYPDMFSRPAEKKVLRLDAAEATRLLQTQPDGDCTYLYDGNLD